MPALRCIPLADLHEDPANVRKHGDRNKASVRASILEFGQVETLVVQRATGRVLGGNCRLGELRALGREGAWCMEVDVEGIDATRLALALNRTAELAEWDADALGRLLADLAPQDLGDLWTAEEVGALRQEESAPSHDLDTAPRLDGLQYRVLIEVASEDEQAELMGRLEAEGWKCQPLIS